ncbi:MAG TPA: alkaline phosphatase family protein [Bryobacteraceae bacterium]|nr:alkaline phosphatase family protein [Bryobacteraceae bacterium]
MLTNEYLITLACLTALSAPAAFAQQQTIGGSSGISHVLLISIDGMHSLDFQNCSKGIAGVNDGLPYCPNLATLAATGINYLNTSTSKPSDSFPGLMAIVTGGSPRTVGAFYDVAYDRSLNPPAVTTGNGVAGGSCTPGATPPGSTTEFDEGIDINQNLLNGGAPGASLTDGGVASIDSTRLERDQSCNPVYPWNFVRTNTIFGVIHAAGGYTAWSDKHPSYSSVSGPGSGAVNVDDYYSPEINSAVVNLPGVTTPTGISCATVPDPTQTGAWTDSFQNIQCYDTLKVNGILNEINGKKHLGNGSAPVPALFGMNFQAVSVGEKLIEKNVGTGGYLDGQATPTSFLLSEIQFVDASIGKMMAELGKRGLMKSTAIVITAKHGQSPIDPNKFFPIPGPSGTNGSSPATLLQAYLPWSESPANSSGIGPTEDDISMLWIADSTQTATAVGMLETNLATAGIGEIYWGPSLGTMFNLPGLPPGADPRTPDILVTPDFGVVYTGSSKKLSEHGGFSHDDTNVMLLISTKSGTAKNINTPVQTAQVAPSILQMLGLKPASLQAVQMEGTPVLPVLP